MNVISVAYVTLFLIEPWGVTSVEYTDYMHTKKYIKTLLLTLAILLMALPILALIFVMIQNILTGLAEKFAWYVFLQKWLVPIQTGLVGKIVRPYIRHLYINETGFMVNGVPIIVTWNCLGWQSMLLFLGSLIIGLQGRMWTTLSKIQTVILGLFGIFWVNILRMSFIVMLAATNKSLFKIVYHDYLAAFVTIVWLLIFWWFSYSYILEEKSVDSISHSKTQPSG